MKKKKRWYSEIPAGICLRASAFHISCLQQHQISIQLSFEYKVIHFIILRDQAWPFSLTYWTLHIHLSKKVTKRIRSCLTRQAALTIHRTLNIPMFNYWLILTLNLTTTHHQRIPSFERKANDLIFASNPEKVSPKILLDETAYV